MNIFICCSKYFYDRIPEIKDKLEEAGHNITLPNSFDNPMKEEEMKNKSMKEHVTWKSFMMRESEKHVKNNDAVLVLNFEKNGQANYIGGATFLEIFKAFELRKKIFMYNPIPENLLKDEITGFNPILINGDLNMVK